MVSVALCVTTGCLNETDDPAWAWADSASLTIDEALVEGASATDDQWALYRGVQGLQHIWVKLTIAPCGAPDGLTATVYLERVVDGTDQSDWTAAATPFIPIEGTCQGRAVLLALHHVEPLDAPSTLSAIVEPNGSEIHRWNASTTLTLRWASTDSM